MKSQLGALLVLGALLSWPLQAQDWSSCASDLDDIRRTADSANTAAEDAAQAKSEVEDKRDELQSCLSAPSIYDLYRDGCQSYRFDYEDALSDYRSRVSYLESELSDVDSRVRSASISCSYDLGGTVVPSARPGASGTQPGHSPQWCRIFQRYVGRVPRESIMKVCLQNHRPDECNKCIPQ